MAEDTQQAEDVPVNETQGSPMPSEEQKTGEVSEEATEPQAEGLPDEAKERTKRVVDEALSKAKTYETQLKEERARREYYESMFQSLQPKPTPAPITPVIDPETGLPNESVLTDIQRKASAAEERATRAEQAIQSYQYDQENRAVYAQFPELDPNKDTHDKTLHIEVRKVMIDSLTNPQDYGGKELSFMEAAQLMKDKLGANVEEVKKQAAQEAIDQLTPKEQASLAVGGNSGRRSEMVNLEEIRKLSRGKDIQARLARIDRFDKLVKQE